MIHSITVVLELVNNFEIIKTLFTDHRESVTAALLIYDRYLLSQKIKK